MSTTKKFLGYLPCTIVSLIVSIGRLKAAESEAPSLFVAPFSGDKTAIEYWQPAMGAGLAEMLVTEIAKLNKYQVLENTQLEALKDEIRLGDDGWVEQNEKVEKGGFAAADFMFTAKVTRFGAKQSGVNVGGVTRRFGLGDLGVKQNTADVRIDWRLVDGNNRKILKTGSSTAEQKGTSLDVGVFVNGSGGNIGFDNKEFMDSALGKATVAALAKITSEMKDFSPPTPSRRAKKADQAGAAANAAASAAAAKKTPGKVLAVANKETVIVSLGSQLGFKNGEVLQLFETVEIKDDKGNVVFTEEKLAGELTLQAVQEERSRASYAGDREIKAGWVVKAK